MFNSQISNIMEEERPSLRLLMKHSEKVQAGIYDNSQKVSKTVCMSNILTKVMKGQALTQEDMEPADAGKF